MDNAKRAKVLIQAMPYIKKFVGETIVVKYGGNAMINEELKAAVMSDLALMQLVGISVVLVHGGGPEINAMLDAVGKESVFKDGMRVTDQETMDIVQMVLAGKVNKSLVQLFERHGGKALGMCGLDGRLLMADKLASAHDLGYVGEIREVNPEPLRMAMKDGYIPIVATVAGGYDGKVYNINADLAAAQIAAKLRAKKLDRYPRPAPRCERRQLAYPRCKCQRGAYAQARRHNQGRYDPQNRLLRRGSPQRREPRAYHRRQTGALHHSRAVQRRGYRNDVLSIISKGINVYDYTPHDD